MLTCCSNEKMLWGLVDDEFFTFFNIFMLINHLINSALSTCITHKIQPLSVPPKAEELIQKPTLTSIRDWGISLILQQEHLQDGWHWHKSVINVALEHVLLKESYFCQRHWNVGPEDGVLTSLWFKVHMRNNDISNECICITF